MDSQAALKDLCNNYHTSSLVIDTQGKFRQGTRLQWVEAHIGIHGNDLACQAAKQTTDLVQATKYCGIPIRHIKHRLRKELLSRWQNCWYNPEEMGRFAHVVVPKVKHRWLWNSDILTAYFTNHGAFPEYFKTLRVQDVPMSCPLCEATLW